MNDERHTDRYTFVPALIVCTRCKYRWWVSDTPREMSREELEAVICPECNDPNPRFSALEIRHSGRKFLVCSAVMSMAQNEVQLYTAGGAECEKCGCEWPFERPIVPRTFEEMCENRCPKCGNEDLVYGAVRQLQEGKWRLKFTRGRWFRPRKKIEEQ